MFSFDTDPRQWPKTVFREHSVRAHSGQLHNHKIFGLVSVISRSLVPFSPANLSPLHDGAECIFCKKSTSLITGLIGLLFKFFVVSRNLTSLFVLDGC